MRSCDCWRTAPSPRVWHRRRVAEWRRSSASPAWSAGTPRRIDPPWRRETGSRSADGPRVAVFAGWRSRRGRRDSATGVWPSPLAVANERGLTVLLALLRTARRRAARLALGDDLAARRRTLLP